jgi:hypothetical protein
VCVRACVHACIRVYLHALVLLCVCVRACAPVQVRDYIVHAESVCVYVYLSVCVSACVLLYACVRAQAYSQTVWGGGSGGDGWHLHAHAWTHACCDPPPHP